MLSGFLIEHVMLCSRVWETILASPLPSKEIHPFNHLTTMFRGLSTIPCDGDTRTHKTRPWLPRSSVWWGSHLCRWVTVAGCWAVMGVSTGSCYGHSEHGRHPRKRWKEPGKVPGEEAMEAESSRSFPEHWVGEAVPSTGGIMSKRAGRVTWVCTYVYMCVPMWVCAHTCARWPV